MKIKELQKTVNIAWSPPKQQPIYLAAGTAAQQFDSNANSTLEIYSTNFNNPGLDLALKASLPSQYRFQKIIWSSTGTDATHPNGLLVGGCEGGHIMIYSPSKILANEESLVARQDKHSGAVSGLDINPFQNNLLASCASESEIFIWDLNNPTAHMNPGAKTQPLEDVKNVAWNRQVQHILASVFSSRCVIWDLRKSEQIIKLSDNQSRVRWHAIQWHPDVATHVWLASEEDQAPVVQLWDLRYATAPAKTYQIHQRGVLGMSWCPIDTDLMVSCGKDNRIYCWNPNTEIPNGEILSEVATTQTWYSDVQWCPRNPALIASSSLDGNVSIYSLYGGRQEVVQTANKIADSFPGMDQFSQAPISQQATQVVYQDLIRAPKWIKRPCGVTFGFGGKLVSFNNKSKSINISQVVTEPELVERANALERSLNDTNFIDYCRKRADDMNDQNGRYLWYFIKANFEINPKEEMLNLLGYNKEDIKQKFSKYIKEDLNDLNENEVDQLTNRISTLTHQPIDNNAIFDDIASSQKQSVETTSQQTPQQFEIPSGGHADSLITEAILTGNLEAAVELCLEVDRTTEALIIASTTGIDFLNRIQKRCLQLHQNDLSNVISALLTRDWLDFVSRCTIESWKEALVAALKLSDRKVIDICEKLGDRLLNERSTRVEYTRNALLCYICAGSIDKLVSAWYQLKQLEQDNNDYKLNTVELQELAEIVMLMSKSLEQQGIAIELGGRFSEFISEYGGLLAAQGALTAALSYIFALGTIENNELSALRERLYNTVNYVKPQSAAGKHPQQQAQVNLYSRQQARGSFSHAYPTAAVPPSVAAPTAPINQYQPNAWNAAPLTQQAPLPPPTQVPTASSLSNLPPAAVPPPLLPTINDTLTQPPRPLSTASSQGGGAGTSSGIHTRSKYILDPSVAPAVPTYGYNTSYNAAPAASIPTFNNTGFNTNPLNMGQTQPGLVPATFNSTPFVGNNYVQGIAPIEPVQQSVPSTQTLRNPTPPPGWNDPPALKSNRTVKKTESGSTAAPITHPLFGVDPNQNQNGYYDPNAAYQNMSGMPPPPSSLASLPQQQQQTPVGGYLNPMNNNQPQAPLQQQYLPQQMNFQTSAIPSSNLQQQNNFQPQQQQQQWNTQQPSQMVGYAEQAAPIRRQAEPPKEKPPLPEEYIYLQTVFEELKNQCLTNATDPRTKRKFVDVNKRLENLYDCLRDGRLTPATIAALNQIVQSIQIGDYGNALQTHTQIAFGTDFSQCAGFMPGLKTLVQSANELQVYLR